MKVWWYWKLAAWGTAVTGLIYGLILLSGAGYVLYKFGRSGDKYRLQIAIWVVISVILVGAFFLWKNSN
jgi:hypothetical protein